MGGSAGWISSPLRSAENHECRRGLRAFQNEKAHGLFEEQRIALPHHRDPSQLRSRCAPDAGIARRLPRRRQAQTPAGGWRVRQRPPRRGGRRCVTTCARAHALAAPLPHGTAAVLRARRAVLALRRLAHAVAACRNARAHALAARLPHGTAAVLRAGRAVLALRRLAHAVAACRNARAHALAARLPHGTTAVLRAGRAVLALRRFAHAVAAGLHPLRLHLGL